MFLKRKYLYITESTGKHLSQIATKQIALQSSPEMLTLHHSWSMYCQALLQSHFPNLAFAGGLSPGPEWLRALQVKLGDELTAIVSGKTAATDNENASVVRISKQPVPVNGAAALF